jgi:hypothetical protein
MNDNAFGHMPAPMEPLTPFIDLDNEKALQEQINARLELMRARLNKKQLKRYKNLYRRLDARLKRARYDQLIVKRQQIKEELLMTHSAWQHERSEKLAERGRKLAAKGREIDQKLAALNDVISAFQDAKSRLEAHQRVLALEEEERENRKTFYTEADVFFHQIKAVFRQSPRLHYRERDSRGKERTVCPEIQRIYLKPDKMYFLIRTSRQGVLDRWAGVWKSALPYGVDIKSLTCDETLENLTAACGRVVTVERGARSQNLFYVIHRLDAADGIPRQIAYEKVVDHYPQEKHADTPWPLGVGDNHKVAWQNFTEFPHVLIAGTNGGGKSNLINEMLATLISMNSPDELRLALIDNKGGVELSHFDNIPHLLMPMVSQPDDVLPALMQLSGLMRARFAQFLKVGARKLADFNARVTEPIPRVVIVIDEMATLIGIDDTPEIQRELRTISSQGRAVGVHLVISTQHPSVDVVPGWIKTNLNLRIAAKMPHHTASQIIVDSGTAATLPDIPGRMVVRRGGFELILQTPLITDAGIARAVKIAREYAPPRWELNASEIPAPVEKFGRDHYLKIAIESLGGKISADRVHKIVGNEVMSLHNLRKLKERILDEAEANGGVIVWNGTPYNCTKDRNSWALTPIETETENDYTEPVNAEYLQLAGD